MSLFKDQWVVVKIHSGNGWVGQSVDCWGPYSEQQANVIAAKVGGEIVPLRNDPVDRPRVPQPRDTM